MKINDLQNKPLCIEIQGDQLTPISIMKKISGKKKFLLESSLKHQDSGRFSFIGADPIFELISRGNESEIKHQDGTSSIRTGNPLDLIKEFMPDIAELDSEAPFFGGAVGYFAYDYIRYYEDIGEVPEDEINMPDVHLMFYEEVVIYDHLEQKVSIAGTFLGESSHEEIYKKLQKRKNEISAPLHEEVDEDIVQLGDFQPCVEREEFIRKVKEVKENILKGDIFQIVLSQRMVAEFNGDPFQFYRKLRVQNPSPYMYFIDFDEYLVAGTSPESLVKVTGRDVFTNPIAGTIRRGATKEEDLALETQLREDPKELAEHRMLVDLGRNDIGKISKFGTVQVIKYMQIERFKHVMHLVSEAQGKLADGISKIDALAACLPAGTVSGAPKIQAMKLINEKENQRRGVYGGAIGYISANGNIDFALAIRTMVLKGNQAFIQAGAGIVHDSIPENEYEETINKLKGFLGERL